MARSHSDHALPVGEETVQRKPGGLRSWEKVTTCSAASRLQLYHLTLLPSRPRVADAMLPLCPRTANGCGLHRQSWAQYTRSQQRSCCAAWRVRVGRKCYTPPDHQPGTACWAVEGVHNVMPKAEMPCDWGGQVYWGVFVTAMAVLLFSRVVAPAAKKEPVRFHPILSLPHAQGPHGGKHGRQKGAHTYSSSG